MANRVVHFEVHADDPRAAATWYGDVFGWRAQEMLGGAYFLLMTGDGPGIDGGVMKRMGPAAASGAPVNAFVCTIGVDNIDAMFAKALTAGAKEALAKMAIPGVGWSAYIHDPFGNILGLHEEDPGAK
jgi:uncharacterized protein